MGVHAALAATSPASPSIIDCTGTSTALAVAAKTTWLVVLNANALEVVVSCVPLAMVIFPESVPRVRVTCPRANRKFSLTLTSLTPGKLSRAFSRERMVALPEEIRVFFARSRSSSSVSRRLPVKRVGLELLTALIPGMGRGRTVKVSAGVTCASPRLTAWIFTSKLVCSLGKSLFSIV